MREAGVGRIVARAVMWVVMAAAVMWAADWLVWQGRVLGGGGYGTITVDRFVVAPLKGHKEEYYSDGRSEVRCTRSLLPEGLPQVGGRPCWWVERNPVVFDR
ncbi:MAG TPA: hypothetical protein VGB69_09120 [Edaphobacter sp.]